MENCNDSFRDEIIRQERLSHSSTDRGATDDKYDSMRFSPTRSFNASLYPDTTKRKEDLLHEELTVLDGLNDRLMEKLARTESRLESAQMYKDEMHSETEAKIAARGAGGLIQHTTVQGYGF